jgi:hypothetical protein
MPDPEPLQTRHDYHFYNGGIDGQPVLAPQCHPFKEQPVSPNSPLR